MKREVTTREYIEYRDAHAGCMDIKEVKYTLYDRTNNIMVEGTLEPTEADRAEVKNGLCSSVILACLDSHRGDIAIKELSKNESNIGLTDDPDDMTAAAFTLRAKTIVWQVEALDEELGLAYVRGVV